MPVQPRTIEVGSQEYVAITITETTGINLADSVVTMAILPVGTRPGTSDWTVPSVSGCVGNVISASLLYTGALQPLQRTSIYRVWALVQDFPEQVILDCGTFAVK